MLWQGTRWLALARRDCSSERPLPRRPSQNSDQARWHADRRAGIRRHLSRWPPSVQDCTLSELRAKTSWPVRAERQISAPWPAIRPIRCAAWLLPSPARPAPSPWMPPSRSEEHTSELQSQSNLVCRLLLEKKKKYNTSQNPRATYSDGRRI